MIKIEKLSYGFPAKDLYNNISFNIERGQHCALIGSNGTGKSTLVDMIMDPEEYLYDGKIIKDDECRIGYASQFSVHDKSQECTVFEYLSRRFVELQTEIARVCEEMATADPEDMEKVFERYQELLDRNEAMDGDNYASNIGKQLYVGRMTDLEETKISQLSGGEYKLLQIMREMLVSPNLLILDEPDVFLDFGNLSSLAQMINNYKGTLLVITHNRYLLNHCFNKILHLENGDLQEFDGNYTEYRCSILREKLKLRIQNLEEQEEIARTEEMVETLRTRATLMVNPVIGRSVNAKQSQLDRLLARQIKAPFIEVREPQITLPEVHREEEETLEPKAVLTVDNYQVEFDESLLQNVSFRINEGEKVALVGANGTGKTTLIRDILNNANPAINIDEGTEYACLSQLQTEAEAGEKTVAETLMDAGIETKTAMRELIEKYLLPEEVLDQRVKELSGGEQNLLQVALISCSGAELLILDEPTSHLDIYGQLALEQAIKEYKGTVLMVSHDFYLVANCADYVLLVENNTVRRVRSRSFRKMVYDKYFDSKYLEVDRKKQEIETDITAAFKKDDLVAVDKLCSELEAISGIS
ncbi:MAG: ABC-F family ATP-binding cassette domain-containing protein [Eubacteriaceae bacterium]|nr:ABC-F family ATP-binding cassette domain-containing protein [Eubacteriaceae bacterium]